MGLSRRKKDSNGTTHVSPQPQGFVPGFPDTPTFVSFPLFRFLCVNFLPRKNQEKHILSSLHIIKKEHAVWPRRRKDIQTTCMSFFDQQTACLASARPGFNIEVYIHAQLSTAINVSAVLHEYGMQAESHWI